MRESATVTLTDFLLARITEDEEVAKAVAEEIRAELARDIYLPGQGPDPDDRGMYRASDGNDSPAVVVGPARVLAECAAKRRIVDAQWDADPNDGDWSSGYLSANDQAVRALALPYAGHPDYDDAWRP